MINVSFFPRYRLSQILSRRNFAYGSLHRVDSIPDDVSALVQKYAHHPQRSISLQTLLQTGRGELLNKTYSETVISGEEHHATDLVLMQVANFLQREIPVRLAHRIEDLDQVPYLSEMKSVKQVKQTYIDSFLEFIDMPTIETPEGEEKFAIRLQQLYEKHAGVLMQMARGAFELRAKQSNKVLDFQDMQETQRFLDRFYMSRIGIRVIVGQYLALREPPADGWIGLIYDKVSPTAIVRQAAEDATLICNRKYGDAPEVQITGNIDLTFPYLPDHLHYILLELIKNSMRATMDRCGVDNVVLPPVKVIIADGSENEDVVIKVSDEGGGIQRSNMKKIWSYLYTTADPSVQEGMIVFNSSDHSTESPLAGLGYGLPISRSYAKYFGGDVDVMSMEGYGTDAFVYLPRLGDSKEPLAL